MPSTTRKFLFRAGWCAGVCVALFSPGPANAQEIYLPPAFGGTPLSFQIESEAKYVAAQGYYLKSAAEARKINAVAVSLELKNWVDAVDDYFKRRDINNEWRRKNIKDNYLENETRRQEVIKQRIQTQFQDVQKGDMTFHLNWLLTELSGPTIAIQYLVGSESLRALDAKLSKEEQQQIYLNDGGRSGKKLVFALSEAEMLKTPWPSALLAPELDRARQEFEAARDLVLKQIQANGRAETQSGQRLVRSVNDLMVALEAMYPRERRKDSQVFLRYNTARQYLQSLCGQVGRALDTNDRSVFDGSLRFQGESVLELIQHMYQRGLAFEKPPPGGERVYSVLFRTMCNLYTTLKSKKEDAGALPVNN